MRESRTFATGAMTMLVACRLRARRERGTFTALSAAGTAGVALMSATNFLLHSTFRWLLLIPVLLWVAGLLCYLRESAASPPMDGGKVTVQKDGGMIHTDSAGTRVKMKDGEVMEAKDGSTLMMKNKAIWQRIYPGLAPHR